MDHSTDDPFEVLLDDALTRDELEASSDEAFGEEIERWHRQCTIADYLSGDGQAVAELLALYINQGHPDIPAEVQKRLLDGLHKYQWGYQKSLDTALGVDTSDRARAARKKDAWEVLIYLGVNAHRRRGNCDPFAEAGARWKITAAQAKQYYYAYKRRLHSREELIKKNSGDDE
ncbi:MAG: hypothetical protein H6961_11625 [Chromatiaceae bacterium]|nr:hypothetical protein [Chromatiaceae bacterium]